MSNFIVYARLAGDVGVLETTRAEFFSCPQDVCVYDVSATYVTRWCLIRSGSAWIMGLRAATWDNDFKFELQTKFLPRELSPEDAARFCAANGINPLPAALVAALSGPDTGTTERSTPPETPPADPGLQGDRDLGRRRSGRGTAEVGPTHSSRAGGVSVASKTGYVRCDQARRSRRRGGER
jgi:hypothetical protein